MRGGYEFSNKCAEIGNVGTTPLALALNLFPLFILDFPAAKRSITDEKLFEFDALGINAKPESSHLCF